MGTQALVEHHNLVHTGAGLLDAIQFVPSVLLAHIQHAGTPGLGCDETRVSLWGESGISLARIKKYKK